MCGGECFIIVLWIGVLLHECSLFFCFVELLDDGSQLLSEFDGIYEVDD